MKIMAVIFIFIGRKFLLNLAVTLAKNGNAYEIYLAGIVKGFFQSSNNFERNLLNALSIQYNVLE